MKNFAVLHDVIPTFGMAETVGPYRVVAMGFRPDTFSDLEVCEYAFEATNSIDRPWFDKSAYEGYHLTDVVQARSTSVGDVIRIVDAQGSLVQLWTARYYRCEPTGWMKLESEPMIRTEVS